MTNPSRVSQTVEAMVQQVVLSTFESAKIRYFRLKIPINELPGITHQTRERRALCHAHHLDLFSDGLRLSPQIRVAALIQNLRCPFQIALLKERNCPLD